MHTLNPPLELGSLEKGRESLNGRVRGAAAAELLSEGVGSEGGERGSRWGCPI